MNDKVLLLLHNDCVWLECDANACLIMRDRIVFVGYKDVFVYHDRDAAAGAFDEPRLAFPGG